MRVEILKPIQGKAYFEGDTIDLDDAQAKRLIEAGFCIPVKDSFVFPDDLATAPIETGESRATPEKAVLKSGKKK